MQVSIPFRLAVQGGERRIDYQSAGKVEQIKVQIPAGIEKGAKLRVAGKGGANPAGGSPGDLYLQIDIEPDPTFIRDGRDLLVKAEIPYSGICLGTSIEVPTLDTPKRVKVPAGMQPGQKIRLRGYGVAASARKPAGDLYAIIEVVVPNNLTSEQKESLEQLKTVDL